MPLELETLHRADTSRLATAYTTVRQQTERLCEPLTAEDYVVQSMPDASPVKWHLAHTSWFFETFVLAACDDYAPFDARFGFLFNSYYNAVGDRLPRPRRGLLSRPTVGEVHRYRAHVDEQMMALLRNDAAFPSSLASVVELGLHHEQQHQELILTDLKHAFSCNPLRPAYRESFSPLPDTGERGRGVRGFRLGARPHPQRLSPSTRDREGIRRRRTGCRSPPAYAISATPETVSPSTTRRRAIAFSWKRSCWRIVWRPAASIGPSWTPAVTISRNGGCPTAGRRGRRTTGRPRFIGRNTRADGCNSRSTVRPVGDEEPVCHLSFYEADAFARWSAPACRPKRNGKSRRKLVRQKVPSSKATNCIPRPRRGSADVWRSLAVDGKSLHCLSGICAIGRRPRRVQRQVHVQSDGAARRVVRDAAVAISGPVTATFSLLRRAGSSPASDLRETHEDHRRASAWLSSVGRR